MSNSTVLVTGANRGIGLEFCRQYSKDGWTVVATTRRPSNQQPLESLRSDDSGRILIYEMDVTKADTIEAMKRDLRSDGRTIDLLVNNAGVMGSKEPYESIEADQIKDTFDVNCLGAHRVTKRLLPLIPENGGTIVMMTSLMGSIEDNRSGGSYPYRISKAGLNMLAKSMSVDLEDDGITVLTLHPGWVRTRMGGENAKIEVEESVRGLRDVIEKSSIQDTGSFLNYEGETMPW